VIGQSTEAEVLGEFEKMVDPTSFDAGSLGLLMTRDSITVPDIYGAGFTYTTDVKTVEFADTIFEERGRFNGIAAFSTGMNRLQLLGFYWLTTGDSQFEVHLSPQRVVQELGPPSHILVKEETFSVILLLVYDAGIVFEYTNDRDSASDKESQYCFGDTKVQMKGAFVTGKLYILEPFDDGLERLSPLQDATVGASIRWFGLQPTEKLFGMSQGEIVEKILHEENTCLIYGDD